MKSLVITAITFASLSSFAGTQTSITCANNSNSDLMMDIVLNSGTVVGASLYNVDWSQTPEATFKKVAAAGVPNPMQGMEIVLEDGNTIAIEWSVFNPGHNGEVLLNGKDTYHCF